MSADIMNRITIDLTGESDQPDAAAPPPSDDAEVVFLSARQRQPPLRLPRPSRTDAQIPINRPNLISSAENPIVVDSDSDESDTEDELFGDRPARRLPPPNEAFRIFSPPAQFVPAPAPPRLPAGAARVDLERFFPRAEPAPPIYVPPPPPRNRLGGGLIAFRDRGPPARYHSQDANRRGPSHASPPRPLAPGRQDRTYLDRILDFFPGRRPQDVPRNDWWGPPARNYRPGPVEEANLEGPWGTNNWDDDDNNDFQPVYLRDLLADPPPLDRYGYHNHNQRLLRVVHYPFNEPPAPQKPTYEPIWTHGRPRAPPGFTFDFEVSDASSNTPIIIEDEPSQAASSSKSPPKTVTSLVCPRCGKGLNMGARSVYALRCGHVLCAACFDDLSLPMVKTDPVEDIPIDIKGKGKVKEEVPDDLTSSPNRRNPRRKVAANPRNNTAKTSAESDSRTPSKKRRRGQPSMKEGQVLEEHTYVCPVGDCLREHRSVKVWSQHAKAVDGSKMTGTVWKQKDGEGAIAVFT